MRARPCAPRQYGGYEDAAQHYCEKSGPAVKHKSGRDYRENEEEEAIRAGVIP